MKSFYLSSLLFALSLQCVAQNFPFVLTVSTADYTDLPSTPDVINLSQGAAWDDPTDWELPIGFTFDYLDDSYSALSFRGIFGYGCDLYFGAYGDGSVRNTISPYTHDLADIEAINFGNGATDDAVVSYQLVGPPGSRILKLEWKNCAYLNMAETTQARVSLQMWLYEGSNAIEFRYGPLVNPAEEYLTEFPGGFATSFALHFSSQTYEAQAVWALTGDPAAPTVNSYTSVIDWTVGTLLSASPAEGTIYHFDKIVGVEENGAPVNTNLYPTQTKDNLTINNNGSDMLIMSVYDGQGKLVHQQRIAPGTSNVDCSSFAGGIYYARLSDGVRSKTHKFIKE
jgi:hypothetical protein